ncbi:hypothetical protein GCM10020367_18710 [Streptomyces sannanensis]|uniref:Transposase n=1 Tax=Streptomyces sannanensis TaxID=285536 RepID=A0ABP6S8M8_9ACTN
MTGPVSQGSPAGQGITLLRPSMKRPRRRTAAYEVRQPIESVSASRVEHDLEQHGGRTCKGVAVRVVQCILALAAVIWRNFQSGQAGSRSLTAYDH